MLGAIVRETIARAPDIELVEELGDEADVGQAVERTGAAVVVLEASHPAVSDGKGAILDEVGGRPRLIAIAEGGRESFLFSLVPTRFELGEVSPTSLLEAIRGNHPLISAATSN